MVNGSWTRLSIVSALITKFRGIYTTINPPQWLDLHRLISPSIFRQENEFLAQIPTFDEVREMVLKMGSNKASIPNNMSTMFYKTYWRTMGLDLVEMVRNFFLSRHMHPKINNTNIVLILKVQTPITFN